MDSSQTEKYPAPLCTEQREAGYFAFLETEIGDVEGECEKSDENARICVKIQKRNKKTSRFWRG